MAVAGGGARRQRLSPARNKLWAQDAVAEIALLRAKAYVIAMRLRLRPRFSAAGADQGSSGRWRLTGWRADAERRRRREAQAVHDAVQDLLNHAEAAATGRCPRYSRVLSWWSGNCVEAAFRNAHNAEATLATLYDGDEARAETPEAVRRALLSLSADDPMRRTAEHLQAARERGDAVGTADLSKVIEAGHAAADRQRLRLRTFRNVLLVGTFVTSLLLIALAVATMLRPNIIPLCFVQDPAPPNPGIPNVACPVKAVRLENLAQLHRVASRLDLVTVAALGLMGGAVSAALFLRDLYSNATPYNVSVPLALLKLPAGAMTGLVGIILLAGEFVPGFSAIDKPIQILAYAVVFGFAQQLFTQFLDQRAQQLVNNIPTKARGPSPAPVDPPAPRSR